MNVLDIQQLLEDKPFHAEVTMLIDQEAVPILKIISYSRKDGTPVILLVAQPYS